MSIAVAVVCARSANADPKKSRDKIVELNKQALLSYEGKDFDAAKESLNKALKEAKSAGLEDDKMTARTYLHLGAVFLTGYKDQAAAIQNFTLAKKIRPDIQLTPSIETPELKAVFDQATAEAEPTPAAEPPEPTKAQPATEPEAESEPSVGSEPDLPSTLAAALMCSTPEEASPGKELLIRCALKPGVNAASVELHYRAPGAEAFQAMPMHRTPKGWYTATLPGHVMKGSSLQVYYEARDGHDRAVASNGQIDSPSVIEIRKRSHGGAAVGGVAEGDPLAHIREKQRQEQYESGLHRRRQGAVWFGFGGGVGWGYAPAGNLEWARDIKVSAISTVAGQFQMVFDGGYMITDNLSLSAELRLEHIYTQELVQTKRGGAPTSWAPAGFLRPTYFIDITSGGNFQFSVSANVGGGYVRLPVKPVKKTYTDTEGQTQTDEVHSIPKTDTRPIGIVLIGPGAGFALHLSRHFTLALEGRLLAGFPDWGVAAEGNLQLQIALGGKSGPAPEGGEDEGESDENGSAPDSAGHGDSEGE